MAIVIICLVLSSASSFVLEFDDLGFYSIEEAERRGLGRWLGGRGAIEGIVHTRPTPHILMVSASILDWE
jgi:hypothetical protein